MNDVVVRGIVKHLIHPVKGLREDLSCLFIMDRFHMLETGVMSFGKNPCLEWKSGGKRGDGDEVLIFDDDTTFLMKLLPNDITENAPILVMEIGSGPFNLFSQPLGDDGKGDDLRVRMFERGPRSQSMVLKDEHILETLISSQIDDPLTIGPQDIFNRFERQRGKGPGMLGRFDDHFVGADPVHLVVNPFAFSGQVSFDAKGREFVRDDPKAPARGVWRSSVVSISNDLRRSSVLISFTERTESADRSSLL